MNYLCTVFTQVLNMSLTAGVVILLLCVARLCLKKLPKIISYALWAVVLFRLVCPISITMPISFIPEKISSGEILSDWTDDYVGNVKIIHDNSEDYDNAVSGGGETVSAGEGGNYAVVNSSGVGKSDFSAPDTVENTWIPVLALVWTIGAGIMLIYGIVSYLKLRRKLIGAVPLRENIFLTDYIHIPFVMGLVRPKIYLPSSIGENEQAYIIMHERHHIRRLDHITRALSFFVLCVHWFNPLAWLAFILSGRDMEMSCDEAVVKKIGENIRADYAESILKLASGGHIFNGMPIAFCEGDTKERIKNLANPKRPAFWVIAISAASCVVLAVCLITNPYSNNDDENILNSESESENDNIDYIALNKDTADEFIAQTLGSLTVNSDGTVCFSLPDIIPVDETGKTKLTISLNAEFATDDSTYYVQKLIEPYSETEWDGGYVYSGKLDTEKGRLVSIMMRTAFMTETGENLYSEYAADYVELTEPFEYDTPAGFEQTEVSIIKESEKTYLTYNFKDGKSVNISFELPSEFDLSKSQNDFTDIPSVSIKYGGENIGTICLYTFGTSDIEVLRSLNPSENSLPMPVFSYIALSNHAGYENYTVLNSSDTGAIAEADYVWQELDSAEMSAAAIPFQRTKCILSYDWEVMQYFMEILFVPDISDTLNENQISDIAESIVISTAN